MSAKICEAVRALKMKLMGIVGNEKGLEYKKYLIRLFNLLVQ